MKRPDRDGFDLRMVALAKICRMDLTGLVELYDASLKPLGYAQVNRALDHILENRDGRDPFPSIKEIKKLICPEQSQAQTATEIAGRILRAVAEIGPYQPAKARVCIGSTGWDVVRMSGGWANVCEIEGDGIPAHRAQWIKLAESLLAKGPLVMEDRQIENRSPIRVSFPEWPKEGGDAPAGKGPKT